MNISINSIVFSLLLIYYPLVLSVNEPRHRQEIKSSELMSDSKVYYVHSKDERGDGSLERPWTMKQAHVEFISMVKGGDRVKHLPGIYIGKQKSLLNGRNGHPIICEPADYNNPPVFMSDHSKTVKEVEGQTFHILGSETWYVNFIFKDEYQNRVSNLNWYKDPGDKDVHNHDMVCISGNNNKERSAGVKLINCLIYDVNGVGLFLSEKSTDVEVYGNVIAFAGFESKGRGHGPGTYMRNVVGKKLIENNIVFANHQLGLRVYGDAIGFRFIDNISFSNGVISEKNKGDANLFIGGSGNSKIIDDIYCEGNICYHDPSTNKPSTRIGYRGTIKKVDLVNETYISPKPIQIDTSHPPQDPKDLTYKNVLYEVTDHIKIVKNKYERNSAFVTVLNKSGLNGANIDLTGIIENGTEIAIWDVQNFKGKPLKTQVYKGQKIFLPLDMKSVSQPVGNITRNFKHTPKEFNCFIIRAVDRNNSLIVDQNLVKN